MPRSLALVGSSDAIKHNLQLFNSACRHHPNRTLPIVRQTTYWIHADDLGLFVPSKFAAYENMDFGRYEEALRGEINGARFDGTKARKTIEEVLNDKFMGDPNLREHLVGWAEKMVGPEAVKNVDFGKCLFVRLGKS